MPLDDLYQADKLTLVHYAKSLEWMIEETARILTIDERGNPYFVQGQSLTRELERVRAGLADDIRIGSH